MSTHDENSEKHRTDFNEIRFSFLKKMNPSEVMKFIKELQDQITKLKVELELARIKSEEQMRLYQSKIDQLESQPKKESASEYIPSWTGIEKMVYILREEKRVMKASQLKTAFGMLEPDRLLAWGSQLSAIEKYIQRAVKSKRLVKILFPGSHCFYGLPEWLDYEGKLQAGYQP